MTSPSLTPRRSVLPVRRSMCPPSSLASLRRLSSPKLPDSAEMPTMLRPTIFQSSTTSTGPGLSTSPTRFDVKFPNYQIQQKCQQCSDLRSSNLLQRVQAQDSPRRLLDSMSSSQHLLNIFYLLLFITYLFVDQ